MTTNPDVEIVARMLDGAASTDGTDGDGPRYIRECAERRDISMGKATRILSALRERGWLPADATAEDFKIWCHDRGITCLDSDPVVTKLHDMTAQRDALQQVIDRLTSDEVIDRAAYAVAMNSIYNGYNAETKEMEWLRNRGIYRSYARTAITAAIAVAYGPIATKSLAYGETRNAECKEGGEGACTRP